MSNLNAITLAASCDTSILIRKEVAKSDLGKFVFGVSNRGGKLKEICKGRVISDEIFQRKKVKCLQLLINSLYYNGLRSLDALDASPLNLVLGVHKCAAHGGYLTLSVFGSLIYVKALLTLAKPYPGIPPMVDLYTSYLEWYLPSWSSVNTTGIIYCE